LERSKKEKMKRKYYYSLLLGIILLLSNGEPAYAKLLPLNWGVTVGLNALSADYYDMYWDGATLDNTSYQSKTGYNLTGFVRLSLNRFFIQPEISVFLYKQDFSFTLPGEENNYRFPVEFAMKSYSGNINALAGYHVVNIKPFTFSLIAGTSLKYIYKTGFQIVNDNNFTGEDPRYRCSGIVGFTFSISKVYFDIRYELNFPGDDIHFNDISDIPESFRNISLSKNENILSFSCGLMF
jgi:hypothetical protein